MTAFSFAMLDQMPIGTIVLRSDYTVLHWNRCLEHWSGIARQDIVGTDIRNRFAQLNDSKYSRRLEQVFNSGLSVIFSSQLHRYIIPCLLPGGTLRVQYTTVTPVLTADAIVEKGSFHALFSIQDITDLTKQAQKYRNMRDRALREAEERGRVEAQVRMLNEQLERRVAERTLQIQQMNLDLTREITEKKHAEEALRESERMLSVVFDTVNVGLSVVNARGYFVRVNRTYTRLAGCASPEELVGTHFTTLYPPSEREDAMKRLTEFLHNASEHEISGERTLVARDFSHKEVYFATTKFTNADGEPFAITALTEITLIKRAENEIRAALQKEKELNELKSHFVSLVSHEFRTPMTIILSSSDMLKSGLTLSEEKRTMLFDRIESSIQRMTELLEDVLFIEQSGKEGIALRPKELLLADVCKRIIDEAIVAYSSSRHIDRTVQFVIHEFNKPEKTVFLDDQLLRYILSNLLLNSFKYSPPETPVDLTIIYTERSIVFRVEDRGIGIPAEDLPKIFDLFHRGKNSGNIYGTGLGLAIVKRCVDAHGGIIECDSVVGKGTTFTVTLPRLQRSDMAVIEGEFIER